MRHCSPPPVGVAIKKRAGSWNCRWTRRVNILTSVNIPPVVNLIAQTPTWVSVFFLRQIPSEFAQHVQQWRAAGMYGAQLRTQPCARVGTSFQATETISNSNLPRVCTCCSELNREDHICLRFVDILVFRRVQKQMQLLLRGTLRKCSGLHLFYFFPLPAPLFTCAQSNNHMCNCLKQWKSAVASFI